MTNKNTPSISDSSPTDIVSAINKGLLNAPFLETIYLTSDIVAGTSHINNIKDLEPTLKEGDKLDFIREPNNPYDKKAILIKHNGNKIGYFPRDNNEILANLMDAGKLIYGKILKKSFKGEWLKIDFKVFLEE